MGSSGPSHQKYSTPSLLAAKVLAFQHLALDKVVEALERSREGGRRLAGGWPHAARASAHLYPTSHRTPLHHTKVNRKDEWKAKIRDVCMTRDWLDSQLRHWRTQHDRAAVEGAERQELLGRVRR